MTTDMSGTSSGAAAVEDVESFRSRAADRRLPRLLDDGGFAGLPRVLWASDDA